MGQPHWRNLALSTLEAAGVAAGWASAPAFASLSWLRRARTFHPRGEVALARVEGIAVPSTSPLAEALGQQLQGAALVRLSTALWKREGALPDVLGCAIRFGCGATAGAAAYERQSSAPEALLDSGDQDLLFATIWKPWTMPFAPFTTDVRDYFANTYFGVTPFDAPPFGRALLRLTAVAKGCARHALTRSERLASRIERGEASLRLEVRRPYRVRWEPVAAISLVRLVDVDQDALRFSPFRSGRGVVPRGFVHAMRRGAYAASQAGRPASSAVRTPAGKPPADRSGE